MKLPDPLIEAQSGTRMNAEQFESFSNLPENANLFYELVDGELILKETSPLRAQLAARLVARLVWWNEDTADPKGERGHVMGAKGGYAFGEERYSPDGSFISLVRLPELPSGSAYITVAPEVVCELEFPQTPTSVRILQRKLATYMDAGTMVLWVVPERRTLHLYQPGQPVKILTDGDILTCPTILPGFSMPVSDIFK